MLTQEIRENRFKFNLPLEILKSDEKGWRVRGIASTEDKDLQGEIIKQNGLDISALKSGRGLFNYEHQNDPENIIGLIEDADVTNNGLHVEGYLFKQHKRAQAVAEIMQSLPEDFQKRVQLSIEGKITERDGKNEKEINKAAVDRVAITFEPVNQNTYLQFAKSLLVYSNDNLGLKDDKSFVISGADSAGILIQPKEEILANTSENVDLDVELNKTLTAAGADVAPAERTGGAALQIESLDENLHSLKEETPSKNKKPHNKKTKIKKSLIKKILVSFLEKSKNIKSKKDLKTVIGLIIKSLLQNNEAQF